MTATNKVSRSLQTPLKFLKRSAVVYPEKVAIVDGQQRFTYREFDERVNRLASALRFAGIEKGDRVAILCPNTAPMLESHFGVPLAGAVLVTINTRLSSKEIGYVMTDEVRVVDEQLNDVPADGKSLGEVVMQGNNVMEGYYHDPEATARAFRGGWFHSGDVAVMHPDGYIELRDRSQDVIISGGEKISSIEVEQALYRHPAVLEVAVIGIPHEKWGETPKAFVTLKTEAEATEAELIEFCREQIAHFKCPSAIEFTALPKTSTGKIQKYVLRNREWAGHEKHIQGA